MARIPEPRETDKSKFQPEAEGRGVKYGLPSNVEYCTRCVISNQRPNSAVEYEHTKDTKKKTIAFDAEGVCDACRFAEKKRGNIDWAVREKSLHELLDRHRSSDGSYDCVVPGSGGKDSFYASHILRTKYGMHPLTVTWAPHVYTEWGWRNFQRWIHAGHDNYLMTPNGRVHRLLTRLAVDNLFTHSRRSCSGRNRWRRRWRCCSTFRWSSTARTKPNTAIRSAIPRPRNATGRISRPATSPACTWAACPSNRSNAISGSSSTT
jgi:hypothetical protein